MSLFTAKTATNVNTNATVQNPTAATQPEAPTQQPAIDTTAATQPERPAYVWDPIAARDRINAAAEAGTITLIPTADGTAYEVSGDTKKVRAYLKGLNARWNPETTNWTLPALALTDPTAASAQRDAIVAERQAKRAERDAARTEAPKQPAKKQPAAKKPAPKKQQPATSEAPTAKTYTHAEVQAIVAKAVRAALGMVAATAKNDQAITAIAAKVMAS